MVVPKIWHALKGPSVVVKTWILPPSHLRVFDSVIWTMYSPKFIFPSSQVMITLLFLGSYFRVFDLLKFYFIFKINTTQGKG